MARIVNMFVLQRLGINSQGQMNGIGAVAGKGLGTPGQTASVNCENILFVWRCRLWALTIIGDIKCELFRII